MIKKVLHHDINFEKYKKCIENSVQRNFYAEKEILDHLCDSWELLVFDDYKAVLPVPTIKRGGFKWVVSPIFCQQLGVFSVEDDCNLNHIFKAYFQKNYRIVDFPFNFQNRLTESVSFRKNYIIEKGNYQTIKKKFSKGRKAILAKIPEFQFKRLSIGAFLEAFIVEHFKGLDKLSDVKNFVEFSKFLARRDQLVIYACCNDVMIISLAILAKSKDDLILLALINVKAHLKYNGATYLTDHIIQENILEYNLDFMGGNLRGIEIFFKSFGAELREYPVIQNSKKTLLKNFLKV